MQNTRSRLGFLLIILQSLESIKNLHQIIIDTLCGPIVSKLEYFYTALSQTKFISCLHQMVPNDHCYDTMIYKLKRFINNVFVLFINFILLSEKFNKTE